MAELEFIPLGEPGRAFVLDHLADLNVFCSALRERVSRGGGDVLALAPVGTPRHQLLGFQQGGLLAENLDKSRWIKVHTGWMMPVQSLTSHQAGLIADMLKGSSRCCVIDDPLPRWDDPDREFDLGPTAFGVGQEVYH